MKFSFSVFQNYPRRQTARKGGILTLQNENDYQDYSVIEGRVPRLRKEVCND